MEKAKTTFQGIYGMMWEKPALRAELLDKKRTALVIIDMVNGLVREGAMKNELAEDIIEPIVELMEFFKENGMPIVALGDCHEKDSPEFDRYPEHCVKGTSETEIVEEIREAGGYDYIPKSSTNGFLEEGFRQWLEEHPDITDFVVAGVCTDICVMQFCLTAKAWFDKKGIDSQIILPLNVVETYDQGGHQITLTNTMAVYFMEQNGTKIFYEINLRGTNPIEVFDVEEGKIENGKKS